MCVQEAAKGDRKANDVSDVCMGRKPGMPCQQVLVLFYDVPLFLSHPRRLLDALTMCSKRVIYIPQTCYISTSGTLCW